MLFLWAVLAGAALCWAPSSAQAAPIRLDFSSLVGGGITFDPTNVTPPAGGVGSFFFNHGIVSGQTGAAFQITNHTGNSTVGTGALALLGDITGTYNVGPISTPSANTEEAVVVGVGGSNQFTITDAGGFVFSADVDWIKIRTTGVGGVINADGQVNLTNVSYGGTNADLLQLLAEASPNKGTATISFQLASNASLTTLFETSTTSTTSSFSGSLSSVPGPAGLALLGVGGLTIGFGRLIRRRKTS